MCVPGYLEIPTGSGKWNEKETTPELQELGCRGSAFTTFPDFPAITRISLNLEAPTVGDGGRQSTKP